MIEIFLLMVYICTPDGATCDLQTYPKELRSEQACQVQMDLDAERAKQVLPEGFTASFSCVEFKKSGGTGV